jgi:hypothetical protein
MAKDIRDTDTSDSLNGARASLVDECRRQSENCAYTSTTFTIWLRCLAGIRVFCKVAPIVFGALATWKMVAQNSPLWGSVFTLLATVIPPAYSASRTTADIEDYRVAAGEFTNLRDRFRQAAEISSHKPFSEFEADTKPLFDQMEKARRRMLTPPEWCFLLARRKHKAHHYRHDYDEAKNGTTTA